MLKRRLPPDRDSTKVFYSRAKVLVRAGLLGSLLGWMAPLSAGAWDLGPGPLGFGSPSRLEVGLYRFEKPSAWWVNLGLPDEFLLPVLKVSELPLILSMRGVEYGVGLSAWPWDRAQIRVSLPMESNRFDSADGLGLRRLTRCGDLETGVSFLALGRRETPFRLAVDAWTRWPTGPSPFGLNDPILAPGRGVARNAAGVWASETSGRFSFFQWIHYEKEATARFDRWMGLDVPSSEARWPAQTHVGARVEWRTYQRGDRWVALVYELRSRWVDETLLNGQAWTISDRLMYSTAALRVRVDSQMTLEGRWTFFPLELGQKARMDYGNFITVVLSYHPLARSGDGPAL